MENDKIIRFEANETAVLDFDPSAACIIISWNGFTTSKEFRPFMERSLEWIKEKIKEHGKLGWVADLSKTEIFSPEDVTWVAESWNPRACKAGIKHIAFVVSENAVAEMTANDYTEQTQETGEIIVNHFNDLESAKDWLWEALNEAV